MSKRLETRHKRRVLRAKERIKLSEPDLRTPEEIKAARETSRSTAGWNTTTSRTAPGPPNRGRAVPMASSSKADS